MPESFNKCVADGGRVRTITLKNNRYMHVCYPKGGGPSEAGEVKQKKTENK